MADWLAEQREFIDWLTDPVRRHCESSAYEHVTRHVTVALCVTALSVTWGTAREQGHREDDDLVVDFCDLDAISAVTGVPCFGKAMAHIEWAIAEDGNRVRFPKFFADKQSPEDRHRASAAERQRRHREKSRHKSNVTVTRDSNVTITHREEKRREENIDKDKDSPSPRIAFTDEDMATARWIWSRVLDVQPGRLEPELSKWANTIRLMRERDARTDSEIRELFTWVNRDSFWRDKCMAPDKLREKWDDLQLRRKNNATQRKPQSPGPGQVHDPNARDTDPAVGTWGGKKC